VLQEVLRLVKNENASLLILGGGLDFEGKPRDYLKMINEELGEMFPVYMVAGSSEEGEAKQKNEIETENEKKKKFTPTRAQRFGRNMNTFFKTGELVLDMETIVRETLARTKPATTKDFCSSFLPLGLWITDTKISFSEQSKSTTSLNGRLVFGTKLLICCKW
jgi:hypothetical protein